MHTHLQEQLSTIYTLTCCTTKMPQWSLVVDHHVWRQELVIVMNKPMLSFPSSEQKMIPGWYVFGALTDSTYTYWEAHAWGYILLPMSDEWCAERNIVFLDDCFLLKVLWIRNVTEWLLHTPTACIDWIEEADATGNLINNYYKPGAYSNSVDRTRSFFNARCS